MKQRFCNGMIHVIKQGENLYQLSRKYRVPLALILRANPYVDVYNLQPGQEICIPMTRPIIPFPGIFPPRPPKSGIEQESGMTEEQAEKKEEYEQMETELQREEMREKEGMENPEEEISVEMQEEEPEVYVTEQAMSLADVLEHVGMTAEELLQYNSPDEIMLAPNVTLNVSKNV